MRMSDGLTPEKTRRFNTEGSKTSRECMTCRNALGVRVVLPSSEAAIPAAKSSSKVRRAVVYAGSMSRMAGVDGNVKAVAMATCGPGPISGSLAGSLSGGGGGGGNGSGAAAGWRPAVSGLLVVAGGEGGCGAEAKPFGISFSGAGATADYNPTRWP